jgi:hypothetical protein
MTQDSEMDVFWNIALPVAMSFFVMGFIVGAVMSGGALTSAKEDYQNAVYEIENLNAEINYWKTEYAEMEDRYWNLTRERGLSS